MVIFGTRAAHVKTELNKRVTCPECGTQGNMTFSIFRNHAHVFWIPIFPLNKIGIAQCEHCKKHWKAKQIPENIRKEYNDFKADTHGPLWQFTGLGIVALLIAVAGFASNQDSKNTLKYIENPEIGDKYTFETESGRYSTFIVDSIDKDSIWVNYNSMEIDRKSSISDIDKEANYELEPYAIGKNELQPLVDEDLILKVKRRK